MSTATTTQSAAHAEAAGAVLARLGSDAHRGLTEAEAQARLPRHGAMS